MTEEYAFIKRELMISTFFNCFHSSPTIYKGRKPNLRNVYDAFGKHILQKHMDQYISKEEFAEMMKELNISPNKSGEYPYRVNPDKYINWA